MLTIEMDNFDLGQICRSGQCFRMDQIGDDRYRVIAGDKYLELTQERGIVNFFCPEEDFIFFWIRYFDLDCDYSEYINMINPRDKYLTAAGEMGSGIRILQQDLWEMIISFLISQQNNITRIKKCIENISREFGVRKTSSTGAEYYAFPTAEALALATEEQLRECNLGYRAKYILLHHAPAALITSVWKSPFIMGIQCLADVSIYRKCIQLMQSEKTDTVSYFLTNSIQSQQFFSCSFISHIMQTVK